MKIRLPYLVAAVAVAGLLSGLAAGRLQGGGKGAVARSHPEERPADVHRERMPPGREQAMPRSTDTRETLAELNDGELYPHLALWLLDAKAEEIAMFWNDYRQKKIPPFHLAELVFVQLTRLDPEGALAAVAGTDSEEYAWRGWASHDPAAALAAAMARGNPTSQNAVARAIGEYQSGWARDHFDKIPEWMQVSLTDGMAKRCDGETPEQTLDFLRDRSKGMSSVVFKQLVRKDPWAACEWLRNNPGLPSHFAGAQPAEVLVATLRDESPEVLEEIAARLPGGELKRKADAALFAKLVESDAGKAEELARKTESPVVAAERWTAVGRHWLENDPERAFATLEEMFAKVPDAMGHRMEVRDGSGNDNLVSISHTLGLSDLVQRLSVRDPQRMIALTAAMEESQGRSALMSEVVRTWSGQDLSGFAKWVETQPRSSISDYAFENVAYRLMDEHRLEEAMDWMKKDPDRAGGYPTRIFEKWHDEDPVAARAWLDGSGLSEKHREELDRIAKRTK